MDVTYMICFSAVIWLLLNVHHNFTAAVCVHYTTQHDTKPMPVHYWSTVAGAGQHPFNTGRTWLHSTTVFTRYTDPMLAQCWPTVCNAGIAPLQHCTTTHVHHEEDMPVQVAHVFSGHKGTGHSIPRLGNVGGNVLQRLNIKLSLQKPVG